MKVARLHNNGKLLIKGEIVENNATNRPPHLTSEGNFMVGELVEVATATPVGSADLIAGNTSAGFYGEVTASEFIDGDELASRLGLTYGIPHNSNSSWLKFEYQNKIEYISKNTFRYNISWNEINEVGLVDGSRTIDIDGFRYKVRLIESDDEINGEYSKLFYPIHIKAKTQSWNLAQFVNIPTEYWGIDYSDADLNVGTGNGRGTWTSSLFTGTKTLRGMGSLEASGRWYAHETSDNFGWRPVLELVGSVSEGTKVSINNGTLEVVEVVEGGGDILVHRYIHQGNKVIQPTGLNKATGLFTTTEPIALAPGTKRQVITAFNYQADGSIPREWRGVDAHFVEVVDGYSFYIRSGSANGEILTYTNTNNNLVDVNSFRFEYDYRNYQVDLSEYNIKKGKFNFTGTRHRPGWSYIYLDVNHSGGNHQHNYGTFADGRDYLSLDITGLFSIEDNFVSARIKNYTKTEWNHSNGTWVNYQGSNAGVLNQSFDNPSFGILRFHYAMANGSVVEIYDIEHSLNSDG